MRNARENGQWVWMVMVMVRGEGWVGEGVKDGLGRDGLRSLSIVVVRL